MRFILPAFLAILLLATPALYAEEPTAFEAGREYEVLPTPPVLAEKDDGRIEVVAFFWYNCGACFALDGQLTAWIDKLPDDVRVVRLPFTYNPALDVHARIFFALREMGLGHEEDVTVFKLFQEKRQPIHKPEDLPILAQALKVDVKELEAAFNSPAVAAKLNQLKKLLVDYSLPGVPSMVIGGKYRFDIGTTQGPEGYFELANTLIERERAAKKK